MIALSRRTLETPLEHPQLDGTRLDIACAGILVADCVARPVRVHPAPGKLALVDSVGSYSGGSAANTGYDLARLGARVAVIGRVGQDGFGDFMIAEAARHGADARLTPEDVPLEHLVARGAKILHLAGFFILPGLEGSDGAPTADLFRQATALGLITSLDCVWDATGRWGTLIRSALEQTDLFCPNLSEAQTITGLEEPQAVAQALLEMGMRRVVALKMGPEGSLVVSKSGEAYRVPTPVVEAVDGTGAGDAFIAGFPCRCSSAPASAMPRGPVA